MSDIIERLQSAIRNSGMTQRAIADKTGITEVSISRYARGERIPNIKTAEKILAVCEREPEDEDDAEYVLTPWGCMQSVLRDYNVDVSHITPKMGEHMVEDFMDVMVRTGYVSKGENEDAEN